MLQTLSKVVLKRRGGEEALLFRLFSRTIPRTHDHGHANNSNLSPFSHQLRTSFHVSPNPNPNPSLDPGPSLSYDLSPSPSPSLDPGPSSGAEDGAEEEQEVLQAFIRKIKGANTTRDRNNGFVPAMLSDISKNRYPQGASDLLLFMEGKQLVRIVKRIGKRDLLSRVFLMDIFTDRHMKELSERAHVLPRNLNYGEGKSNIVNAHLVRAPPDTQLIFGVPIVFEGERNCPALRKGGSLIKLAKFVTYCCLPSQLPAKIIVDLTVAEIGDKIAVKDIEVDKELLHSDEHTLVCELVKLDPKPRPRRRRNTDESGQEEEKESSSRKKPFERGGGYSKTKSGGLQARPSKMSGRVSRDSLSRPRRHSGKR